MPGPMKDLTELRTRGFESAAEAAVAVHKEGMPGPMKDFTELRTRGFESVEEAAVAVDKEACRLAWVRSDTLRSDLDAQGIEAVHASVSVPPCSSTNSGTKKRAAFLGTKKCGDLFKGRMVMMASDVQKVPERWKGLKNIYTKSYSKEAEAAEAIDAPGTAPTAYPGSLRAPWGLPTRRPPLATYGERADGRAEYATIYYVFGRQKFNTPLSETTKATLSGLGIEGTVERYCLVGEKPGRRSQLTKSPKRTKGRVRGRAGGREGNHEEESEEEDEEDKEEARESMPKGREKPGSRRKPKGALVQEGKRQRLGAVKDGSGGGGEGMELEEEEEAKDRKGAKESMRKGREKPGSGRKPKGALVQEGKRQRLGGAKGGSGGGGEGNHEEESEEEEEDKEGARESMRKGREKPGSGRKPKGALIQEDKRQRLGRGLGGSGSGGEGMVVDEGEEEAKDREGARPVVRRGGEKPGSGRMPKGALVQEDKRERLGGVKGGSGGGGEGMEVDEEEEKAKDRKRARPGAKKPRRQGASASEDGPTSLKPRRLP
eukprot:gene5234-18468_t